MKRRRAAVTGAAVSGQPKRGSPTSSSTGIFQLAKLLLLAGVTACSSVPPLLIAAEDHDVARVVELLDAGADPNVRDSLGQTALQIAAYDDDDEIVRLLLDNGALVDFRGDTLATPLMIAASRGSEGALRLLLDAGADPHAGTTAGPRYVGGETSLMVAANWGHISIVRTLIAEGVELNTADGAGNTALSNAASGGRGEVVSLLLERGADPNSRDRRGRTPARVASERGHHDVAAQLASVTKQTLGASAKNGAPRQDWLIPIDGSGWQVAHRQRVPQEGIVEYIPRGEEISSWSQIVTTHFFLVPPDQFSLRQHAELQRKALSRDCPSLEWTILSDVPEDLMTEWRHTGCQGYPAQHQLSRTRKGQHGVHTVSFARRTTMLPTKVRAKWVSALRSSRLVSPAPEFAFEAPTATIQEQMGPAELR